MSIEMCCQVSIKYIKHFTFLLHSEPSETGLTRLRPTYDVPLNPSFLGLVLSRHQIATDLKPASLHVNLH